MNRCKTDDADPSSFNRGAKLIMAIWYRMAGLILISEYVLLTLLAG